MFFWVSIVASSSIVYLDGGSRALAASHPLIALFFAMGMSSRGLIPAMSPARSRLSQNGFLGLVAMVALFICLPWMAHHFSSIRTLVDAAPPRKEGEAFYSGAGGCPASSWSRTISLFATTFLRLI